MGAPIDPCGYAVDVGRVGGYRRMRFWKNRTDESRVRWYRVPWGTPALPIPHVFGRTDFLPLLHEFNPGEGNVVVGEYTGGGRYDKGAPPVEWRPPTKFIGTEEQWQQGSEFPRHRPLVWRGGFSTACKAADKPQGMACAVGCEQCGVVSPIWIADGFDDFAGMTQAVLVQKEGCEFSSGCVPAQGLCSIGTAAAWEVVPETEFGGLTGSVVHYRGDSVWSGCCEGV